MMWRQQKWFVWSEIALSWLVLLLLLFYTYVELVKAPYLGFNFGGASGRINSVFLTSPNQSSFTQPTMAQSDPSLPKATTTLQEGDHLHSVNGMSFDVWRDNLHTVFIPPVVAGDVLQLEVERGDEIVSVAWRVTGFNRPELRNRMFNSWLMGYFFWLAGLATLLLVRPYDLKRSLFAAFFFLTALWLVVGNTSRWDIGESRVIYRMALCLSVPVMLHLHWLFPRPLAKLPGWVWGVAYVLAVGFALFHLTPYVAVGVAALSFGVALMGSVVLLFFHYLFQPEVRPQVRLLFYAVVFAMIPLLAVTLTSTMRPSNYVGTNNLLALPIIPGAYFFSIYRYQLGGIELRANRVIAVYLYVMLLGTVLLLVAALLGGSPDFADSAVLWVALLGMAAALVTLYGFPHFRRVVDRRLLAMPLPPAGLIDTYLARITTTLNEPSLVQLLKFEVMPSLLVRQSALLRIHHQDATLIYSTGEALPPEEVAHIRDALHSQAVYRVPFTPAPNGPQWVRLALALQVEGRLLGMWLLGRHDPDDLFSPIDIATLQTLARQTALALANIEQAEQLQALYQASIERQEQERMKMAHFLHDAILNSAAVMYMSLDAETLTPRVEHAYTTLKAQIHQMISNLRPPSLDLGLGAALEEFVDELAERATDASDSAPERASNDAESVAESVAETGRTPAVELQLNLPFVPLEYPPHIENHIFRIVQQACENAVRHAHARHIRISGTLAPHCVELTVADDGVGFVVDKPLNMAELLADKHFGLVHMMERAEHIHAALMLDSTPGEGTRVHLTWRDDGQSAGSSADALIPGAP